MALATWWRADPLMRLIPLSAFHVRREEDDLVVSHINRLTLEEVQERRRAGHRPYLGYVGGVAVTYGWVATRAASIGELSLAFSLPAGNRYLWDFATLPKWQGRGLYPRLLQGILRAEAADRFWIIHAPENLPSGAGIHKAGFQAVGQLSFLADGTVGLVGIGNIERAPVGAALLGVPLIEDGLSPCWRCMDQVVCNCRLDPDHCDCAIEVRSSAELRTLPDHTHPTTGQQEHSAP
ncbi:MAG: GNAT family N-acetyltransferase [Anaerolineae bacterium]|nr:GNAT family N-acetyltransferase [Anaerolineae bacterium]